VARQCRVCGVKLLGDEVAEGVCQYCRDDAGLPPRPVKPAARANRGGGGPDWDFFRAGLNLLAVVTVVNLVLTGAAALSLLVGIDVLADLLLDLGRLLGLVALVQGVMTLIGLALLCAVPSATGLRGRAWGMVGALLVVGVAPCFGAGLFNFRSPLVGALLLVLVGLGGVIGFLVCLTTLLSGAARYLGEDGLANGFVTCFVTAVLAGVMFFVSVFLLEQLAFDSAYHGGDYGTGRTLFSCMMGLFVAAGAGFGGWFLRLLLRLRRATL
jgi:hypothetical protein